MISTILGSFHRLAGRSQLGRRIAVKVRNQSMAIIRASLNDGIDLANNGELWLLDIVAPGATCFIDVGANVGNWAHAFLKIREKTGQALGVLLEPAPNAYSKLIENMRIFDETHTLKILPMAASDCEGELPFYEEENYGETSSLVRNHSNRSAMMTKIKVSTVDLVIENLGLKYVDLLKIDAEGYDLHVLKGSLESIKAQAIGAIQFEYNAPWAYAGSTLFEALDMLKRYGYRTFLLKADGLKIFDYEAYGEYYGYSNFVALSDKSYQNLKSALFQTHS